MGLAPKYFVLLIGKKINKDTTKGTPVSWDLIF
jgi:N-acetylneuraminate synthase